MDEMQAESRPRARRAHSDTHAHKCQQQHIAVAHLPHAPQSASQCNGKIGWSCVPGSVMQRVAMQRLESTSASRALTRMHTNVSSSILQWRICHMRHKVQASVIARSGRRARAESRS